MLDKSALAFLAEQAVAGATPTTLPGADTPVVVIGGKVHDLEEFQSKPLRHRANFTTKSLPAFIAYSLAEASAQSQKAAVFVNPDNMSASALFDIGTPGEPAWSGDRAGLNLKQTADFQALMSIHEKRLFQKQIVDFAIDWAQSIAFIGPDGETLPAPRALAALRSITIAVKAETHNEERDTGRTRSAFEEAEAKSKETLPAGFIFLAAPYLGLDEREINVRLTVNTEGEKPTVTPRIVGLEKLIEALGEELVEKLEMGLGDNASILIGTMNSTN